MSHDSVPALPHRIGGICRDLMHDDWEEDRATGHDFFEKVRPDGDILRTHASRSDSKTMSPGRFKSILSDQLRLSEAEFWEVLRTRSPAQRPSPGPEPAPRSLPLWLAQALEREVGLTRGQIAELDEVAVRSIAGAAVRHTPCRPSRFGSSAGS